MPVAVQLQNYNAVVSKPFGVMEVVCEVMSSLYLELHIENPLIRLQESKQACHLHDRLDLICMFMYRHSIEALLGLEVRDHGKTNTLSACETHGPPGCLATPVYIIMRSSREAHMQTLDAKNLLLPECRCSVKLD